MVPSRVATADGRQLDVLSFGAGPGVVVVHGAVVSARDYRRVAGALADRFTVHLYDRRGRGDRGPVDHTHGVTTDIGDLHAVLVHTGARNVLAHSYGGLVALRGAAVLPVDRLVAYDPAVSVDGSFPSAYLEPFARAAAAGDFPLAMAEVSKGLGSAGAISRLPVPVLRVLAHGFALTRMGNEWRRMLASAVVEAQQVLTHDGPAAGYADITAEVLLATGARSPIYFARTAELLADAIPRARSVVIPRAGHNAINIADATFVGHVVDFFGGPHPVDRPRS